MPGGLPVCRRKRIANLCTTEPTVERCLGWTNEATRDEHSYSPFPFQGAIADQAALEQFQKQWATYQDALAHKEVGHGALPPRQSPRLDLHDQDEWDQIDHHVTTCDYPETSATWVALGREAGFADAREMFCDPTGFYRVYRYDV
jgi:hypothetical protein